MYRKRELPGIGNESFRVSETRTSDTRNKVKPHRGFRHLHHLRPRLMDKGSDSGVLPSKDFTVATRASSHLQVIRAILQGGDDKREGRRIVAQHGGHRHGYRRLGAVLHEEEAHGISRLAGDLDTLPAAGSILRPGSVSYSRHRTLRPGRADDRRQPLLHVADDHADVRQLLTNLCRGGTEHDLVARRVELRLGR